MKKLLAVLSILLVAALMLTACGSETGSGTKGQTSTSNGEYAGMGDGKTLVYWCEWNESETQWNVYKDTIARFEADTGYKVDVQHYGRDINTLYAPAIDAGQVFDIYDLNGTVPKEGYTVDIDEYMEKYGVKEDILPIYATYQSNVSPAGDGHWYAVPSQPFFGGIFYNKAIFKEAGITSNPTTWAEFMDDCQKIKDAGYAPITVDDAYISGMWSYQMGVCLGGQAGTEELVGAFGDKWKDTQEIMNIFQEMAEKGYFADTVGGNQFPAAQNGEFAMGTAAMYGWDGSWVCNEVHDITGDDFDWGFMLWPGMTNDDCSYIETCCQQIAVSPTSTDVAGASLLLKYMVDAQTCEALRDQCQCIPVVADVEWPAALADVAACADEAENTFFWCVYLNSKEDVTTLANTYFHQLIGGTITADEFVDHMVKGK